MQCQHPWTQALGFPNPPTPHCSVSLEFPWGPGGKSGDKGPGRFSILCLTPVSDPQALRGCVGRPRVCGGTERVPGGKWGRGGAERLRPKADRDHHVGPQPGTPWCPGGLNTRMLITEAANRLLDGAVLLLRRPQDIAQSTAPGSQSSHEASCESEDLGGREPGLLPSPCLQQAPVSTRHAPLLTSSSSSICTPHPSTSSSDFLDPEACRRGAIIFMVSSREGMGDTFRVPPSWFVPLSGDSAWRL